MSAGRKMGYRQLTALAGIWITVCWIGADMYLPALPGIVVEFGVSEAFANLTLVAYTIALPIGSILGGPISDKTGRMGPTLVGAGLTIVFNLACALSPSLTMIIGFRFVAGLGAGVITATAMAILRDHLEGEELESALTYSQSLAIIGPIAAPFLGSLMLFIASWRAIFVFCTVFFLVCLVWYLRLGETYPPERRKNIGVMRSLGQIFDVAREAPFTVLLIALCLAPLAFGVYLTVTSYIYIDSFGLNNFFYSIFYGLTCLVELVGPFVYNILRKRISNATVLWICVVLLIISGVWIVAFGQIGPLLFFIGCIPFTISESMCRPCSYVVLLTDESERAGSVSALISFGVGLATALGTPLAALPLWGGSNFTALGGSSIALGILTAVCMLLLVGPLKCKYLKGRKGE